MQVPILNLRYKVFHFLRFQWEAPIYLIYTYIYSISLAPDAEPISCPMVYPNNVQLQKVVRKRKTSKQPSGYNCFERGSDPPHMKGFPHVQGLLKVANLTNLRGAQIHLT